MNNKLGKDFFYIEDLMGLSVFSEDRNKLGIITRVWKTAANDVYVVKNDEREVLIPAIKKVVKKIDLDKREMVVCLLEGLDGL
ncbi:16S rRNA processing protein RimM [bacterium]|nr:16S rRNA processing protein RimM [bacterium]